MNNIKLYHKDVFWNKRFDIQAIELIKSAEKKRRFSKHFINDRLNSGLYNRDFTADDILQALKMSEKGYIFEIETSNNYITKACIRLNFTDKKDICIVCRYNLIVTAWTCYKNDRHKTLNTSKYEKGL